MELLLESPVAVAAIGLTLVTMAAVFYTQTKSVASVAVLGLAVLLAVGAVLGERAYQTPREQALATVYALFDAIEANDLPAVVALIDPRETNGVRADAETLMPLFRVQSAGTGGEVRVELTGAPGDGDDGATATMAFKPLIKVLHTKSGAVGAYFDRLTLELVRRGDRWLLHDYEPAKDWSSGAAQLGR